jgi:carbamoyl-phosphate synthase large subunit
MQAVSKKLLELGFTLISTEGTAQFLAERGIEVDVIEKVSGGRPNIIDLIINGEIALVINIPGGIGSKLDQRAIYRSAVEQGVPLITTLSGANLIIRGFEEIRKSPLHCVELEM